VDSQHFLVKGHNHHCHHILALLTSHGLCPLTKKCSGFDKLPSKREQEEDVDPDTEIIQLPQVEEEEDLEEILANIPEEEPEEDLMKC